MPCPARQLSSSPGVANLPSFGLMFDIDGVIVRGKTVLPSAPEAFQLLYDGAQQRWRVPTIFVTNAGNSLRQEKADKLSGWLGCAVTEEQVVMAHSPLKMFTDYHEVSWSLLAEAGLTEVSGSETCPGGWPGPSREHRQEPRLQKRHYYGPAPPRLPRAGLR